MVYCVFLPKGKGYVLESKNGQQTLFPTSRMWNFHVKTVFKLEKSQKFAKVDYDFIIGVACACAAGVMIIVILITRILVLDGNIFLESKKQLGETILLPLDLQI